MTTETKTDLYGDVVQHIRNAAEANVKLQQDMLRQWSTMWPGFSNPQTAWLEKVRDFQHQWANTVSDLARTHRDVLDKQYQASLESLEEALRVSESSNPEEFRKRTEQLCRKMLDCVREVSETQFKEFQEAVSKWTELATKAGN